MSRRAYPGVGMDYEIYPLAISKAEWSIFIDVCQRYLGYSPTRGVDGCHLEIDDPAAFLGSLNMENDPLETLRLGSGVFEHFSITFLAVLDEEAVCLMTRTPLKVYWKADSKRKNFITLLSGTMDEWYRAILAGCTTSANPILRWVMNHVIAHFERVGFREIFSRFKKQQLQDGTFVLK